MTKIDRLPPHSIEAEQGVLGCILLALNDCDRRVHREDAELSETFYDLRHQTIFQTLVEMFQQSQGVDLITLQQRLKDNQQLENVGRLAVSLRRWTRLSGAHLGMTY